MAQDRFCALRVFSGKNDDVAGVPMEDAISLNVVSGGISFIGSAVGLWLANALVSIA